MANWQKITVTDKGNAFLAKITATNGTFPLTRIAFGSGAPSNLKTATALSAPIDNAEIISRVQADNTCTITLRFSNAKFTKAYDIRELGIFVQDPDAGEIMFGVTTDTTPDHIQAANANVVVTKTIVLGIGYSDASNVTVTLSNVMWVTAEETLEIAKQEVLEFSQRTYTINDERAAAITAEVFPNKMDELGNRIKAITGKNSWITSPSITLEQAVKAVTRSGDTITVTTGSGRTSTFSVDNVTSANSINITNAQDLVIDASGTTPSMIRLGYSAYNYSGTGITEWDFYNLKGGLANVKANRFIGSLQGTADYANYATTMGTTDNSTRIATTAYVQTKKSEIIGGAPSNLSTLDALAASIGDDANYATTVNNALALKANLVSPSFTGAPTAPTASTSTNSAQIATTAFVKNVVSPYALTSYVDAQVAPKADTTYVDTKTNDKYSSVTVNNATLTFKKTELELLHR